MQLNITTPGSVEEVKKLRTLFEDYLKMVYWTEKALIPVISFIIKSVNSKDFARILTLHLAKTHIHRDRIEKIFESIGIRAEDKKFDPISSLIHEIEVTVTQTDSGVVRDAAIIALVQHIIHSEIASYGTLKSFAITLREEDVVELLEKNLVDEKELDYSLSVLAEAYINDEAANKEV
ncbi:MAG TPA: DUF892 family protein [Flavobacterium sp.]|jgi:ferritin-like metal-binding protein YciE